jgi:hypothetical protein
MEKSQLKKLSRIVSKYRKALKKVAQQSQIEGLKDFPVGACGVTSELLGAYLLECGFEGLQIASGNDRSGQSHSWLELRGIIIDITGNQFKTNKHKVLITQDRQYHSHFHGSDGEYPDFDDVYELSYGQGFLDLQAIQNKIIEEMNSSILKKALKLFI